MLELGVNLQGPQQSWRLQGKQQQVHGGARLAQECGDEDTGVQVEGGVPPAIWEVQDLKRRQKSGGKQTLFLIQAHNGT